MVDGALTAGRIGGGERGAIDHVEGQRQAGDVETEIVDASAGLSAGKGPSLDVDRAEAEVGEHGEVFFFGAGQSPGAAG